MADSSYRYSPQGAVSILSPSIKEVGRCENTREGTLASPLPRPHLAPSHRAQCKPQLAFTKGTRPASPRTPCPSPRVVCNNQGMCRVILLSTPSFFIEQISAFQELGVSAIFCFLSLTLQRREPISCRDTSV